MILQLNKRMCALLSLAVAGLVSVHAASNYRTLVVSKTDGTNVQFTLTPNLNLSFSADCLQVRDDAVNIDVPRSILESLSFSEDEAGVDQAYADRATVSPIMTEAGVRFCNLPLEVTAKIYSVDGKLIKACPVIDGALLPYSEFASGLNILEVDGVAFKIYVK